MSAERHVPILLYHGIVDGRAEGFDVSLDAFRRQLEAVVTCGRQPQTITELAGAMPAAGGSAAVTFDDGTADFWEAAWPALAEYGVKATLYVTTGAVGGRHEGRPMVSWRQLNDLREAGVEIGSHGPHPVALGVGGEPRAALGLRESKLLLEGPPPGPGTSFAHSLRHP